MDVPSQLKMIPALVNLQKMSEQDVRIHPPMVLLVIALMINLLLFAESRKLTSLFAWEPFYSVRNFIPFNGGKTFWLVMMVLRRWQSHHRSTGDGMRAVTDCLKWFSMTHVLRPRLPRFRQHIWTREKIVWVADLRVSYALLEDPDRELMCHVGVWSDPYNFH